MCRKPAVLLALAALLLVAVIAGCGDDSPTSSTEPVTMDVNFEFNIDGQPLLPNQMIYTNPGGRKYSIKKLRFVLTDIHLYSEEGNDFKLKDLHFFDMEDISTFQFSTSSGVPHAEWNRISFTFGLDETRNVRDKYINMTKFQAEMAWPTSLGPTLGYHYMQLEGDYEQTPGGATASYTTHTGAHQVVGTDPVPLHYFFTVDLPFTPTHVHEGGEGVVTIHFELNGWYTDHTPSDGTDTQYDFTDYPAMIMGNAAAQEKLQANGPFCFSATMTSSGGHH